MSGFDERERSYEKKFERDQERMHAYEQELEHLGIELKDYHTGLICHEGASFPSAKSHPARAYRTDIIMTVEILKMLQVENLTIGGGAGRPDPAYRQSVYFNRIVFASVGERA